MTDALESEDILQPDSETRVIVDNLRARLRDAVESVEKMSNILENVKMTLRNGANVCDETLVFFAVHKLYIEFDAICRLARGDLYVSEAALKAFVLLDEHQLIRSLLASKGDAVKCQRFTRQLLPNEECTLMHYTVKCLAYDCFQYLLQYFQPVNEILDSSGRTIGHYIAMTGDAFLSEHLHQFKSNQRDIDRMTIFDYIKKNKI